MRTPGILAVAAVATGLLAVSCSQSAAVTYENSAAKPVIVFTSNKAISHVYNPDSPVVLLYGDGTLIKKLDSYSFQSGAISDGVQPLLDFISSNGFFSMEPVYTEGSQPGGSIEVLEVHVVRDGKPFNQAVSAPAGHGPKGWSKIVSAVTGAPITSPEAYVPQKVLLFATERASQPEGSILKEWPQGAGDLSQATTYPGVELSGPQAAAAWAVIGPTYENTTQDFIWSYGGKLYSSVGAAPEFTGVETPGARPGM